MNTVVSDHSSRMRIYWRAWLAVLVLVMIVRFTAFLGADSDSLFILASVYGVGTWLPVMALNMIEGRRLTSWLCAHHPEKWERLSHVPGFGPGMANGFRMLPWLYSADDLDDLVVTRLKNEYKSFIKWMLTVFFSYILVMPVLLGP